MFNDYELINQLENEFKYSRAIKLLKLKLGTGLDDDYLYFRLANICRKQCMYEEAFDYLSKAKQCGGHSLMIAYNVGLIYADMHYDNLAIKEWNFILNDGSNVNISNKEKNIATLNKELYTSLYVDVLFYKAISLYHIGLDAEAEDLAYKHLNIRKRGLQSDFTKKEVLRFIGNLEYEKQCGTYGIGRRMDSFECKKYKEEIDNINSYEEQARLLEKLCRIFPGEYILFTELSNVYYQSKLAEKCLASALKAKDIEDSDPIVIFREANALYLNNKYEEAIERYNAILLIPTQILAYGQFGEGLRYAQYLKNDSRAMKGLSLLKLGKETEGKRLLRRHLRLRKPGLKSMLRKRDIIFELGANV